jgi:hypothetical protein
MFNVFYITLYGVSQHNRLQILFKKKNNGCPKINVRRSWFYKYAALWKIFLKPVVSQKSEQRSKIHQEKWHFFAQPQKCLWKEKKKLKKINLQWQRAFIELLNARCQKNATWIQYQASAGGPAVKYARETAWGRWAWERSQHQEKMKNLFFKVQIIFERKNFFLLFSVRVRTQTMSSYEPSNVGEAKANTVHQYSNRNIAGNNSGGEICILCVNLKLYHISSEMT